MPAGEPALTLPFELHGYVGAVRVHYRANDDPVAVGHDLVAVGYDEESFRGYPVIWATVHSAPLVGIVWGYDLADGRPTALDPAPADLDRWDRHLPRLRERYPTWTFAAVDA